MKKWRWILLSGICILLLSACESRKTSGKGPDNTNSVNKVLENQVSKETQDDSTDGTSDIAAEKSETTETEETQEVTTEEISETITTEELTETVTSEQESVSTEVDIPENADGDVDYDLTTMSSDLIYATVYQMMVDPDQYTGKTFRIEGNFYASYYDPTQKYYFYCIIQDATACCSQGLEFVWGDGTHVYPDEYPDENAEVVVEGRFETYTEEGDSNLYARLADAELTVK